MHTNSTPNYGLPQFVSGDSPTWLGDVNGAMLAIDTAVAGVATEAASADAKADLATTAAQTASGVATDAASAAASASADAASAITTAGNAATAAQSASTAAATAQSTAESAATAASSAATAAATAQSAAESAATAASSAATAASAVDTKVGDLTDLTTTDKTSIVNAINEVAGSGGGGSVEYDAAEALGTQQNITGNVTLSLTKNISDYDFIYAVDSTNVATGTWSGGESATIPRSAFEKGTYLRAASAAGSLAVQYATDTSVNISSAYYAGGQTGDVHRMTLYGIKKATV